MINSLYIHIPFCKKKCNYCDFVSYAGKEELIEEYVEAVCEEINSPPYQHESNPPPSLYKRGGNEGGEFSTIYFGGGTPTLLEPRHFGAILKNVAAVFRPPSNGDLKVASTSDIEVTIEANPGTADKTKLKELRKLGINRLSIGAQTFNNQHLKILGRIHTSEETLSFYDDARSAGFENINLDLIFALPNQTLDDWKKDLEMAIHLNPNHLSTYNLQVEEGTPLWEKGASSAPADEGFKLPSEETELTMYEYTIETLMANGFRHYEISNFAQPGRECKHNVNYWKNGNYIGVGAGAHSHVNGKRWANLDSIENYLTMKDDRRWTIDDSPDATHQRDTLFMGLRLLEGLPAEKFQGFEKEVAELIGDGLLTRQNGHYKLTRRGLYLANLVFEKFV